MVSENHDNLRELAFKLNRAIIGVTDEARLDMAEIGMLDGLERDAAGYFRPRGDVDSPVESGCDYAVAVAERAGEWKGK